MTEPTAAGAAEEHDGEERDQVLTVPNAVTAVRLLLVPVYVWLLFATPHQIAAAGLLAVLGATDWVDGYLARRLHQVSKLGKVLDPTADRVLVITAVLTIAIFGAVPWWFAVLTLVRELLVSAAVLVLASMGAARIDVLWVGKCGTFALMTAYPLFLASYGTQGWQTLLRVAAWGFGLIGLGLAWMAAYSYLGPARRALADGRAGRRLN